MLDINPVFPGLGEIISGRFYLGVPAGRLMKNLALTGFELLLFRSLKLTFTYTRCFKIYLICQTKYKPIWFECFTNFSVDEYDFQFM